VVTNPPLDLPLAPINGEPRPLAQWVTTFHLVLVALDPFTNESAWILPTASRLLINYQEADCRIAWLVSGTASECRQFLGPWAREILTFADPDRVAIKGFGLDYLPALLHVAIDGTLIAAAEGWDPVPWRALTDNLSRTLSWNRPTMPLPSDPMPFPGTPAAG
jgi:hypothetical protein